jgi:hypothetical protein
MVDIRDQVDVQTQAKTEGDKRKTRLAPAFGLFFLAPLVGEFLLGNLPITWLWALISLAPLYGAGALLIRELARRLQLGWPGIVILGLAYAVIEEAFVTQSLFNPDYLGLSLLDYGFIPGLGISAWWTVFVLSIHTIWSTAVPIALVESLTPSARRTPWLGPLGLGLTAVLFIIGCFMTAAFQEGDFQASTAHLTASAVVVILLIAGGVLLGRRSKDTGSRMQNSPTPVTVGAVVFVLSSAFMLVVNLGGVIPAAIDVAGMLILLVVMAVLIWRWAHGTGWSEMHRLAIAGGFLLTYAWYGFIQYPSTGEAVNLTVDIIGNAVFAAAAVILLILAWRKVKAVEPV